MVDYVKKYIGMPKIFCIFAKIFLQHMLQLTVIRENKEEVIARLSKRNIDAKSLVEKVLSLDENKRALQTQLEELLAESNKISKEIGQLMKSGNKDEAEALKNRTTEIKSTSKELQDQVNALQEQLPILPM